MFEEHLLPLHGPRCPLHFDVGFCEIGSKACNIAAAQNGDSLSTADKISGLDLNRDNTATYWRKNPNQLCGIRLHLCRELERFEYGLLSDLNVANWGITRLVIGRSHQRILTGLITARQEQRYT